MQKILLIQTAFIGDVVLTTPLIRQIKLLYKEASLSILVNKPSQSVLAGNPHLAEILVFDKKGQHRNTGFWRLVEQIRQRQFNLLLAPHESHRTGLLAFFSRIPLRMGYKSAGFARLAYHKTVRRRMDLPESQRLLAFLADCTQREIHQADPFPELFAGEEDERQASSLLAGHGAKFPVLIAPSSVWPTKRWPVWHFARLIAGLLSDRSDPVFIVGSAGDAPLGNELIKLIGHMTAPGKVARVANLCGKTEFGALFALMKKSRLLISNDSAPVHFAQAARLPVICIMGPTTPDLGYAPITPESRAMGLDLRCRPCGTHGARRCPLGHFRCMQNLSPEEVLAQANMLVGA